MIGIVVTEQQLAAAQDQQRVQALALLHQVTAFGGGGGCLSLMVALGVSWIAKVKSGVRSPKFLGSMCTTAVTHWLWPCNPPPPAPHVGSNTRALLVSQDRRHLFMTPWSRDNQSYRKNLKKARNLPITRHCFVCLFVLLLIKVPFLSILLEPTIVLQFLHSWQDYRGPRYRLFKTAPKKENDVKRLLWTPLQTLDFFYMSSTVYSLFGNLETNCILHCSVRVPTPGPLAESPPWTQTGATSHLQVSTREHGIDHSRVPARLDCLIFMNETVWWSTSSVVNPGWFTPDPNFYPSLILRPTK
jgi:hypothetical protein